MKRLIVCTIFVLSLLLANAQQYPKALLSGDYPDPTILRDGDDFYMTHSPFVYAPGFLIWHSTDLHDWQPLCRAIPEFTGCRPIQEEPTVVFYQVGCHSRALMLWNGSANGLPVH